MLSVGRYRLLETLGEGGMGVVYKAFDPLIERTVAVKLISARLDESPELRQRFFAEARAVGQLSHRNIVTIFDLGEDNGHPYFAMEFLEGRNLRVRMQSPERMSLDRKLEVMAQVCEGLAFAHSKGITHRDVKPANVFITDSGHVKILDFGLARLPASELTHSKTLIGTLNYMAPEQISGEKTDLRTDVFAVGVVFYELLSSRSPFEADSVASLLNKILRDVPQPLGTLDPGISPRLSAIVDRALAKAREERYQNLNDLLVDLAECRAQLRGLDPTAGNRQSGSHPPAGTGTSSQSPASPSGPPSPVPGVPLATPPPAVAADGRDSAAASRAPSIRSHRPGPLVVGPLLILVGLLIAGTWSAWRKAGTAVPSSVEAVLDRQAARGVRGENPAAGALDEGQAGRDSTGGAGQVPNRRGEPPPTGIFAPPVAGTVGRERPRQLARPRTAPGVPAEEPGRREADAAHVALRTAKANADSANALELAPAAYSAASDAEASAARLLERHDFSVATAKLYEASGLFRRAEIEARAAEQARTRGEPAPRIEEQPARQGAPSASPPGQPTSGSAGTPAPAPRPETAPGSGPVAAVDAEAGIRDLLAKYTAALESRSFSSLKRIWPGLSGAQERAIREEFQNARSIGVRLSDPVIEVAGPVATVRCRRSYELETLDGHHLQSNTTSTLALRKNGATWVIDSVRHDVAR